MGDQLTNVQTTSNLKLNSNLEIKFATMYRRLCLPAGTVCKPPAPESFLTMIVPFFLRPTSPFNKPQKLHVTPFAAHYFICSLVNPG